MTQNTYEQVKQSVASNPTNPRVNINNGGMFLQALMFCRAEITDSKHRVQTVKDLVKQLPKPNQDTMQALFKHLKK